MNSQKALKPPNDIQMRYQRNIRIQTASAARPIINQISEINHAFSPNYLLLSGGISKQTLATAAVSAPDEEKNSKYKTVQQLNKSPVTPNQSRKNIPRTIQSAKQKDRQQLDGIEFGFSINESQIKSKRPISFINYKPKTQKSQCQIDLDACARIDEQDNETQVQLKMVRNLEKNKQNQKQCAPSEQTELQSQKILFSKFKFRTISNQANNKDHINNAYYNQPLNLRQEVKKESAYLKIHTTEPRVNVYTNTRRFAFNNQRAAARLKVQRKIHDTRLDIGLTHAPINGKCLQNIGKASIRDTDIIFGPRDPDLHTEIGDFIEFKLSKAMPKLEFQTCREQAGKIVPDSHWLRLKGQSDEQKDRLAQIRYQRDLFSLQNFEITDLRNPKLEYKGEVPMDFNMLGISKHQKILKFSCELFKEKTKQTKIYK